MGKLLFISGDTQDYLADSLFHGLRSVLGSDAIDFPRRDPLYRSYGADRLRHLYGRGFTLYGLLDDLEVDRSDVPGRIAGGEFETVVIGDIWRAFGWWVQVMPQRARTRIAVVDGADLPLIYPYAPTWLRVPGHWTLPRAHRRVPYFKRELTRWTLPRARLRPIAFSIPAEKLVADPPPKSRLFQSHIVDPDVARRVGDGSTAYRFEVEEEYYADLRSARFGITTRKGGWETLRHYEIAANGTVPCFRRLDRKPRTCAPHGLGPHNSIGYSSYSDLMARIEALDDAGYARLQAGAMAWAQANTTEARARELLAQIGHPLPDASTRS